MIVENTDIDTNDFLDSLTRGGFPKVVIVMTDGIQSRDRDAMPLNRAAEYVRRQGARVLVVGIGPKIVKEQLNLMVTSPSDVFAVHSFDSLIRTAREVAVTTCTRSKPRDPILRPCGLVGNWDKKKAYEPLRT